MNFSIEKQFTACSVSLSIDEGRFQTTELKATDVLIQNEIYCVTVTFFCQ